MSLQLCFISEWLLRKLLHKMPVKMEEGSNTDLKKPRAFSIFSPYIVDEKCVWERESPDVFPLGLAHLLGFFFFNDSKIHAIPFLCTPFCCSPSVLPPFTHLDLTVWVLVWSPSVKDDTTVGSVLTSWDWAWHPGSLYLLDNLIMAVLIRLSVLPVLSIHIITHVLVFLFVHIYLILRVKAFQLKCLFYTCTVQYNIT